MPDYPQIAVHETLVNALVHRDYMIQGSEIHIDMYDDRLEIVSPGGMVDGRRIQDLNIDDVASVRRNPILCDIFHRLKLMERRGSGLQKIRAEYPADSAPVFRSTEQAFIVTLKNMNYQVDGQNETDGTISGTDGTINGTINRERILQAISGKADITFDELSLQLGIPRRTVSREIQKMQEDGLVRRIGSRKTGYWEVLGGK